MLKSPFKFLDSYTREDRDIFFGREQEIKELYRRLFESKILLVYGISGTGKSSLIHCGLANKIQESDWLPINVRRGGDIVSSMGYAIQKACQSPLKEAPSTPTQFNKAVRSLYLDYYKIVFFIFDQFEELFIFGSREEKNAFIQVIKSLADSDLQCRFIFIMREEYLAGITELEKIIPEFLDNRIRIELMSFSNAKEAITGPCKVFNIELEEGFADELLERLSPDGREVELTYLQVFLDKIFRLAEGDVPSVEADGNRIDAKLLKFNKSLLQRTGNVSDLLGSFLDEQIAQLTDPDSALAVLKSFVSVKGTKRQMSQEEVQAYTLTLGKPIEAEPLRILIQTFIQLRILRDKDQNGKYELRHDALAEKIYEKITLVEKELLEIRQLVENAYNKWEKRGVLLSKNDLQYIAPYESRLYMPSEFTLLIEKSKNEFSKARKRRRNRIAAAVILVLIAFGGFTIWALRERADALVQKRQAQANNYNFLSKELIAQDPTIALRLAEYAHILDSGNKAILNNLNNIYYDNVFYTNLFLSKGRFGANENSHPIISPQNKKILVLDFSRIDLDLWDLKGNLLKVFEGHLGIITSYDLSNDGKLIASISQDSTLRLWDLQGNTILKLKNNYGTFPYVRFSPDSKLILIIINNGNAEILDLKGKSIKSITGENINSLICSMDESQLVAISNNKTARIYSLKGNSEIFLTGQNFNSAIFAPDSKSILTTSEDNCASLWDLKGNKLQTFKGHTKSITTIKFSNDGKTILSGSNDNSAIMWNLKGEKLLILKGHEGIINAVGFSPNGQSILTGSSDGTARLWDLHGNVILVLRGHSASIETATFNRDGSTIITSDQQGKIKCWNILGTNITVFGGFSSVIKTLSLCNADKQVMVGTKCGFHILDSVIVKNIKLCNDSLYEGFLGIQFSPDGRRIVTGLQTRIQVMDNKYSESSLAKTAQIRDENGRGIQIIEDGINPLAFSADGKTILGTGIESNSACLWDLKGNNICLLKGHTNFITSGCFSSDGKFILTGSYDGTIRLWSLEGKCLQVFRGINEEVSSVAISPGGKLVASGCSNGNVRIWDMKGNTKQVLKGHELTVTSVAFSKDNKSILTGSEDKTARLWDLEGNTLRVFKGHSAGINSAIFSQDERSIITGSQDKTVRVWQLKNSLEIVEHENKIAKLSITQKLNYSMLSISDVLNLENPDELFEAIDFYIEEVSKQTNKQQEDALIENALNTLNKVEHSSNDFKTAIQFITHCITLYRIHPQRLLEVQLENKNKLALKTSSKDEIKELWNIYNNCMMLQGKLDSVFVELKIPEYYLQASRRAIEINPGIKESISGSCSNLSFNLLAFKKYALAIEAVNLAIEIDPSNQAAYTNLPLALIFNNRYNEAGKVYLKYKYIEYESEHKPYREIYLEDITDLESRGITHPDFAKVKELLKK